MIKFIFFDVADTLLEKPKIFESFSKILPFKLEEEFFNQIFYEQKHHTQFPDHPNSLFYFEFNSRIVSKLHPDFRLTPEQSSAITEEIKSIPWSVCSDVKNVELLPSTGVISNWGSNLSEVLKEKFPQANFNPVICSSAVFFQKPSLDIFNLALAAVGLMPHEVAYIGDQYALDYLPAKRVGMQAILLDRHRVYADSEAQRDLRYAVDFEAALRLIKAIDRE